MDNTTEETRTTPDGLLTDAIEMFCAAGVLIKCNPDRLSQPIYYLLGHSIEVALKAILLQSGKTLEVLKGKYGHDLCKAARSVIGGRSNPVSKIVKNNLAIIECLNPYYIAKEFEYRVTGFKRLPRQEGMMSFLNDLLPAINELLPPRRFERIVKKIFGDDRSFLTPRPPRLRGGDQRRQAGAASVAPRPRDSERGSR